MKQFLTIVGIILGVASLAVTVLWFIQTPAAVREDFSIDD